MSIVLTGCQETETPAPAATVGTDKAATQGPEPEACSDCIPGTVDNFNRVEIDTYVS